MFTLDVLSQNETALKGLLALLLSATIRGTLIFIAIFVLLHFRTYISAHLRHQLYFYAVLSFALIPIMTIWINPKSIPEFAGDPQVELAAEVTRQESATTSRESEPLGSLAKYTFEAAGKFQDVSYSRQNPKLPSESALVENRQISLANLAVLVWL